MLAIACTNIHHPSITHLQLRKALQQHFFREVGTQRLVLPALHIQHLTTAHGISYPLHLPKEPVFWTRKNSVVLLGKKNRAVSAL